MTQTRGFLLGKFMPPHEGHLFLCDVAADLVDVLTVLVCSRDCEPIAGDLRVNWMKESVKSNVRVVHLHRDIPQEPSEHPDFWGIWRQTIEQLHPESIDLVFGSEDYILRLATELQAEPFIIDKNREVVPVSATQVRSNPRSCWEFIPGAVRPFYQKRICLLGPESTGKSELCKILARRFDTHHVAEYGRDYDVIFKQGKNWQAADFLAIAKGHRAMRKQLAKRAGYLYFEDTDLIQTIVWAEFLLGEVPENLQSLLPGWDLAHFYLLLKPDVSWEDDGTRYSGDRQVRDWFFDKLASLLSDLGLPFQVVGGKDWCTRENSAVATTEKYLEEWGHKTRSKA